jgi:adenosine deaminase
MQTLSDRWLRRLPKAELHTHLEGTFEPARIAELARAAGQSLPRSESRLFEFEGLSEFLQLLDWWCSLVRTPDAAEQVAFDAAERAARDGIVYAEFIVNPTHWRSIPRDALVSSLAAGFDRAASQGLAECRLLISLLRQQSADEALELVEWMGDRRPHRVVGLSIDGNEAVAGSTGPRFAPAFCRARELRYSTTAHAGESSGPEGVLSALDDLGVRRIDHGVRAAESPSVVARLVDEQVTLNVCLSSNLALLYRSLDEHPIGALVAAGVPVTINTDDPVLLGTTLSEEFAMAARHLQWSRADAAAATERAITAAFCEEATKRRLRTQLANYLSVDPGYDAEPTAPEAATGGSSAVSAGPENGATSRASKK